MSRDMICTNCLKSLSDHFEGSHKSPIEVITELRQENARLREALEHIEIITFKGSKDFDEFIKAWPNSISMAKDSDALSSLIYGFVKKALEETK